MNRTCLRCGWVAFAVSRKFAEDQVRSFNNFYDSAPKTVKKMYGHRATILDYERCLMCGGPYTEFREFKEGDCPDGVTLSPIILDSEAPRPRSREAKD